MSKLVGDCKTEVIPLFWFHTYMFEGAFKVQFCNETTASRLLDGSCNIVKLKILKGGESFGMWSLILTPAG